MTDIIYDSASASSSEPTPQNDEFSTAYQTEENSIDSETFNYSNISSGGESAIQSDLWAVEGLMSDTKIESEFQLRVAEAAADTRGGGERKSQKTGGFLLSLFPNEGVSILGVTLTAARLSVPIIDLADIDNLSENPIGSGASTKVYSGEFKGRLVAVKYFISDPAELRRKKGKAPLKVGGNGIKTSESKKYSSRVQQQMGSIIEEMTIMAHAGMQPRSNIVELLGISIREIGQTPEDEEAVFDPEAGNIQVALVMELADTTTPTLSHWVEGGFVAPEELGTKALILSDITNGILTLHDRHITHGDIKPENILMFSTPERPVAKVSDFGLSDVSFRSMKRVAGGTELWAAPEAKLETFDQEWAGSQKRDVYSFGLVAYYTLLGRKHSLVYTDEETFEEIPVHIALPRHLRDSYRLKTGEKCLSLGIDENEDFEKLRKQIAWFRLLESWQRPKTEGLFEYLNSEAVSPLHAAMIEVVWPGRLQERKQKMDCNVVIESAFWFYNFPGVFIVDLALKTGFLEWELSGIGKSSPSDKGKSKDERKTNVRFISAGIYALNACLELDPEMRPSMQQLKDILHVRETGEPKWLESVSDGIALLRSLSSDGQPFRYRISLESAATPMEALGSFHHTRARLLPLFESEIGSFDTISDRFRAYVVCFMTALGVSNYPKAKYYYQHLIQHEDKIKEFGSFNVLFLVYLLVRYAPEDSDMQEMGISKAKANLQQIVPYILPIDADEICDAFQSVCEYAPQPAALYEKLVEINLDQYLNRELRKYKLCRNDTPGIVSQLRHDISGKASEMKDRIQKALSSNDELMARHIQRDLQTGRGGLSNDDIAYLTLYAAEECRKAEVVPRNRLLSIMIGSAIEEHLNESKIMQMAFESHSIHSHFEILRLFLKYLHDWSVVLQPKVLAMAVVYDPNTTADSLLSFLPFDIFEISSGDWKPKDLVAMAKAIHTPVNLNGPHHALAVKRSRHPALTWAESFAILHISVMVDNMRIFERLLKKIDPAEINALASGSFHVLHLAALRRNPFVIARLLMPDPRFQVDPDVRVKGPSLGYTSLHLMCRFGWIHIINTLTLPSNPKSGPNDLANESEADRGMRLACIDILLKHSQNPNAQDWEGLSPLHVYIQLGDIHAARMLLSDPRINPCLKNFKGDTVLHIVADPGTVFKEDGAKSEDWLEVLKFCLEYPAIRALVNEKNHLGMTPLALALVNDEFRSAEQFVAAGADITCRDVFGTSILQNVVGKRGPAAGLRLIWELLRLEDLDVGVTRDKIRNVCRNVDDSGKNVLHYACACMNIKIPSGDCYETPSQFLEVFIDLVLQVADDDSGLLGLYDNSGLLPTDLAMFAGHEEIADKLMREDRNGLSEGAETMDSIVMEIFTDVDTLIAQWDLLGTILEFLRTHNHGSLGMFVNFLYYENFPTAEDKNFRSGAYFVLSAVTFMNSGFQETMELVDALDFEARMQVPDLRGSEGERDYGPRFFELSGVEDTGPLKVDPNTPASF